MNSTIAWDGATSGNAVHLANWSTGRALCGAYVVPTSTTTDPGSWRPRCRRCSTKAGI